MGRNGGNLFLVDSAKCTRCGECVADCPVNIIEIDDRVPFVSEPRSADCIGCQHCLAVCPEGAVSVLGLRPEHSLADAGAAPLSLEQVEHLLKGRRSVRRYLDEEVDPAVIDRLLRLAAHAPSGRNDRRLSFSVIERRQVMDRFREQTFEGLAELLKNGELPPGYEFFTDLVNGWRIHQADVLYRWAPHLLVVSVPADSPSAQADGFIALSHFETGAVASGLGTLWNGLARMAISLLPELRIPLGIPADDLVVMALTFGKPAVLYARAAQYEPLVRRAG